MGIQSSTNQIIGAINAGIQPEDPQEALKQANLELKQRTLALKNKNLDIKESALKLQQDKIEAKRAAFEKSLERKQHAMNRVKNGKELSAQQKTDIEALLAEAKRKREARARVNG